MKKVFLLLILSIFIIQDGNSQTNIEITFDSSKSQGAELLQSFNLRDSGEFVNLYYRHYEVCQFSDVMEYIEQQALRKGGNLIVLEEVMYPGNGAKRMCYGLKGAIFKSSGLGSIRERNNSSQLDSNEKTQVVFYRPSNKFLRIHKVKIYNEQDELILEVKDGEEKVLDLDRNRMYVFRTKRNKKNKFRLDLRNTELNKIYIRVGIIAGAIGPDGDLYLSSEHLRNYEMERVQTAER
ncbi:hypothetical protein [Ekhidna sp.]|uniref:hypothetical protein n=1 Tax=Ekhidna sp. TaxID=2608089 RepID=UPI003B5B73D7